ncbi:type II secretion system major pseudopilin GspG [Asticcacaulis sp. 201]|uniref:type II secretion system major pseudopilin GspG n=1 Tax=Asticcacaulis sp. 201 TaxID=3028787 RepID=UPI0029167742|nr:type II secretion system major pseudopilin GspG [Asticcacaulis sp. 201]MDV6331315.1 type II secretion system major pseudopilin GspG [Asticcacaulis sp. 201]
MRKLESNPNEAGYTLTEMLVVILIITLIAAVLTPTILSQLSRAKAKTAALQLDSTAATLTMFKEDIGRFPTEAEGLKALVEDPGLPGWVGPYLKTDKSINDPWNHKLVYKVDDNDQATLTSLGADGKAGGKGVDQDITVTAK